MTVFPMRGAHAGDLLLALPAIGQALQHGPVTVAGLAPKFYLPFRHLPVEFRFTPPEWAHVLKPVWTRGRHCTDLWLDSLGRGSVPRRVSLPLLGEEEALRLLPGSEWLVISPWSDFVPKRWPAERWQAVANFARTMGFRVAVVGPPSAAELGREICRDQHLNLVGCDTPDTWPALLGRASAVLTTDSASVHVADALGVPVIGLYGVSRVSEFGPYWRREFCVEADGMEAIEVSAVCNALRQVRETCS